ncbi:uncharacterized protein [Dermacentor andersoni]|uniref:uncharacterized protein isoform X1 n=1 Tax=Dermacentor andersoni TaxID=34620 RepID=UPI002416F64D|nr:uncharacterized protein LOC126540873 isoform X1 [Dermacentor andersoni]
MMSAKLSKTVNLTAVSMALIKMRRRRRIVHSGASTPNKGVGSPDETKDGVQADADNDDDDDEDPEQLPFLLVAGAVVVALSILFLGIWTFNFIIAKALQALNGTEEMKLRHFLKDVMRACISKECHEATAALADSVRSQSANPCSDFYNFCCGLWNVSQQGIIHGGNHSGSYHLWLEERYVTHVHSWMLRLLTDIETGEAKKDWTAARLVARAYQSCVAFFANVTISGHLISMWKSAGMDTVTWMKVANFSQLFTLVVLSTLNNHLPSALSVDYDEHGTVDVYTGSPIEMNSINSDLISELIDEASSALELRYPWALTASVKRLDGAVRVFTQSARANMKSVRTVEKGALDLDAVGVRCVEFLHLQFNRALPTVMADDEETEDKVADTIVAIWKHVRGAALEWWNLSKGLELNKTVLRDHMSAVRIHTELEPVDTEEDPALEEPYSDDFLSNLVLSTRLTGHRINISQELGRLPLIRGQFEAVTLQPDFLYPMAPEPSVNYGTMGVMIAKLMFDSALQPASPHDGHRVQGQAEEAFGTCLASYAKEALNVTFEPTEWKVHARTKWAMEAAFLATRRNYNFVGKLVMDRFLFVRFGRTFCGDTYLSPLQFATKSSTLFATVFSCKRAREALC